MFFGTTQPGSGFVPPSVPTPHRNSRQSFPRRSPPILGAPRYQANEVNALLWVYATLIESAVLAYESILSPLTPEEREGYYAETKTFAALFGIPSEVLPADWAAFEAYNPSMHASDALGVNALSRELAHGVLHGAGSRVPVPRWYRALTASWMPERLRAEFALDFAEPDKAAATRALRWLPRIYRRSSGYAAFCRPLSGGTSPAARDESRPARPSQQSLLDGSAAHHVCRTRILKSAPPLLFC